jgi:phosphate starvation-inducible protein PhoH
MGKNVNRADIERGVDKMAEKNKKRKGKAKRKDKVADNNCTRKDVKSDKFQEDNVKQVVNIQPKTENQKIAMSMLREKALVILSGNAGSGKTLLSCWWAAKQMLEGNVDRIIITRPNEINGRDGGATPGTDLEKLQQVLAPMMENLSDFLGRKRFETLIGDDPLYSAITVAPLEKIAGRSFRDRTIVIADELQMSKISQMRSLTTRMEEGSQLILLGDPKQAIRDGENGLSYIVKTAGENPLELEDYVGVVNFTKDDCVRGGLAGAMVRIFDDQGPRW